MINSVLKDFYKNDVVPQLMEKRSYTNQLQVPRLLKIVINSGVSSDKDKEVMQTVITSLSLISGQKPVVTKARKSISNFKLRAGDSVGCRVTLRSGAMYNFLYRLVNIALPRVRDFRGVPAKAFDGAGNYTFGLTEQSVFTEIDLDKIKHTLGMNITFVTTAGSDDEARDLLAMLGMPFAN